MYDYVSLRVNAIDVVESIFQQFDPVIGYKELLKLVEELCLRFHIIAVAGLLEDGDPQKFFLNLCRAAENWRRFLIHCQKEKWPLPPASKIEPLFGAVVAGSRHIADGIVYNSNSEWIPGEEYEDEFLYAMLVNAFYSTDDLIVENIEKRIDALQDLGVDGYSSRIGVARALRAGDKCRFDEAFTEMLAAHEEITEKRANSVSTPYSKFAPYRYVWLEGLAWLKLAERVGVSVSGQYRYCPVLARTPMVETYSFDWALPIGS